MKNKFLNWFVVSSANPEQSSMTLKGFMIANIAVIMFAMHALHLNYSIDQVTVAIGDTTAFVGYVLAAAGLIRKLYYGLKGAPKVLDSKG